MLEFPPDCDTPAKRTEYCYRAQELLRQLHNGMGQWYREGLTFAQWEKLPQRIKDRYPYKTKLSQAEWDEFTSNVFEPINTRIVERLLGNRELLFQSKTWEIHVEDI